MAIKHWGKSPKSQPTPRKQIVNAHIVIEPTILWILALSYTIILNGTQKEKKVESPKDNSTTTTGFVAKSGTFQPIWDFSIVTKGSD